MTYSYGIDGSNWLTDVDGNGLSRDYVYDPNGNMTADGDYVTDVDYDIFNMPIVVTTTQATAYNRYDVHNRRVYRRLASVDTTFYVRGADGTTLAVYDGSGDLMYWNILGAGEIVGRAVKGASSTDRQYYVKDHLGSNRVTVNESGSVDHQSDYYPFGLEMPLRVTTTDAPRERYTGHEIEELGSNTTWYYAGARMYDPVVARWMTTDPLGQYPSPYVYVGNNPVMLVDPTGLFACEGKEGESARDCQQGFSRTVSSDCPPCEEDSSPGLVSWLRNLFRIRPPGGEQIDGADAAFAVSGELQGIASDLAERLVDAAEDHSGAVAVGSGIGLLGLAGATIVFPEAAPVTIPAMERLATIGLAASYVNTGSNFLDWVAFDGSSSSFYASMVSLVPSSQAFSTVLSRSVFANLRYYPERRGGSMFNYIGRQGFVKNDRGFRMLALRNTVAAGVATGVAITTPEVENYLDQVRGFGGRGY